METGESPEAHRPAWTLQCRDKRPISNKMEGKDGQLGLSSCLHTRSTMAGACLYVHLTYANEKVLRTLELGVMIDTYNPSIWEA